LLTKWEVIDKTLNEMNPAEDYAEVVISELKSKLPDREFATCEDIVRTGVLCCDTCHRFYPHYDMYLMHLADGTQAWACCAVLRATESD
jgi:hypothetical protein